MPDQRLHAPRVHALPEKLPHLLECPLCRSAQCRVARAWIAIRCTGGRCKPDTVPLTPHDGNLSLLLRCAQVSQLLSSKCELRVEDPPAELPTVHNNPMPLPLTHGHHYSDGQHRAHNAEPSQRGRCHPQECQHDQRGERQQQCYPAQRGLLHAPRWPLMKEVGVPDLKQPESHRDDVLGLDLRAGHVHPTFQGELEDGTACRRQAAASVLALRTDVTRYHLDVEVPARQVALREHQLQCCGAPEELRPTLRVVDGQAEQE
mmetsp:Transcript_26202/g.53022  ORF Transcript_26202/g.53022 Transcript_26202/m.53022 type:complete len:261 (-) Transcript_26202:433-1215(-)